MHYLAQNRKSKRKFNTLLYSAGTEQTARGMKEQSLHVSECLLSFLCMYCKREVRKMRGRLRKTPPRVTDCVGLLIQGCVLARTVYFTSQSEADALHQLLDAHQRQRPTLHSSYRVQYSKKITLRCYSHQKICNISNSA